MKNLTEFPQTIKTQRLVLRVIIPSVENAKIGLDIIEKNRDYLENWQKTMVINRKNILSLSLVCVRFWS